MKYFYFAVRFGAFLAVYLLVARWAFPDTFTVGRNLPAGIPSAVALALIVRYDSLFGEGEEPAG